MAHDVCHSAAYISEQVTERRRLELSGQVHSPATTILFDMITTIAGKLCDTADLRCFIC
jgi:hypothetical protein